MLSFSPQNHFTPHYPIEYEFSLTKRDLINRATNNKTSTILKQELRECNKIQLHHHLINGWLVWPLQLSIHPHQFLMFIGFIGCTHIHFLNNTVVFILEYDVHCHCQFLQCCTSCAEIGTSFLKSLSVLTITSD